VKPPRLTLRLRLTLWYAVALLGVLSIYAGVVYIFVSHSLWQQLDHHLHESVEDMEALLPASWTSPATADLVLGDKDDDEDDTWVEVWSHSGVRLYHSSRAERQPLKLLGAPQGARKYSIEASSGHHVRINDEASHIGNQPVIIRVAQTEDQLRDSLWQLFWIMGVGLPLAVGLTGVVGYQLARRALGPVDRMTDRARTITAERLSERLAIETPDDEIGRLATVFNDMLARLETAFEQMRRFTADASHELRTPLTAIRTVGEVALRERREATEYRDVIGSMLEETDHVTRLVDALLMLSRADAGQIPIAREAVSLADLAHRVAAQLEVLAEEKQQTLSVDAPEDLRVEIDPVVLRLALVNLLDNAITYSQPGARITVRIRANGHDVTIDVEDNGPGIAAVHHARLFDRFYRVDEARTRRGGSVGVGLGLAITRWAVEVQQGRVEVISAEGQGSIFRIHLPA
jgi:heavy metal sensor kinase